MTRTNSTLAFFLFLLPFSLLAQKTEDRIQNYLQSYAESAGFTPADVQSWEITDEYTSRHNGLTHVHIRQLYNGIPVYNAVANFAIRGGKVLNMASRLEKNLAQRANTTTPSLSPQQAIESAAQKLELGLPSGLVLLETKGENQFVFSAGGISRKNIPVRLLYQPGPEGELFLAWDLSLYAPDGKHWWSVRIDALTGILRDKGDWIKECLFPDHPKSIHRHTSEENMGEQTESLGSPGNYRVFPYRIESPNHGPRTLEIEPADSLASPFGWHDTDGITGAEFTITRGNNVFAREDRDDNDTLGHSPDGGPLLDFDFPLNLSQQPSGYEDAAITNLFYLNNIMHDYSYQYGFDEQSGNFQETNYSGNGFGGDYVFADAQDGGGLNNANFGTPPDGESGYMQMFLWSSGGGNDSLLTVNFPGSIAGLYITGTAGFGPQIGPNPITADVVLADDGTAPDIADGCEPFLNAGAMAGKIVMINRGNCTFVSKVQAAQNAGAIAVIIVNNVGGNPQPMGGASSTITIPSVMIRQVDGNLIRAQIVAGNTVNVTLQDVSGNFDRDGDFDNGIIAHEYAHGISNRLTGGGSNVNCLDNSEQMGEGWSDYFSLMLSIDTNSVNRGIGTYAIFEPINGGGIRPAQYSPDFAINPYTYDDTNNQFAISEPHGIGFIWCTMLWDMTLALVEQYGFDPDQYKGTGGNNIAMQLVMDGMKLQVCGPGFTDGRDAILLADQINNGGANQCLIWEVFARRGLGYSASQGNANSRSDQVEAFDIPPICETPLTPPTADYVFSVVTSCNNKVNFTDKSTNIAQQWLWDFGDGTTDTLQNPIHTYLSSGTYNVVLIASNTLGSDTLVQTVTITLPPAPVVSDAAICRNESATFSINGNGVYIWYDENGAVLDTGALFQTPILTADTTFYVEENIIASVQNVGPLNGSIGAGGYHNTGFTGTVNFTAQDEFMLISAWTDAGSAGPRTIFLWDNINGSGNIVDQVTINIPAGPQRVTLNLHVPGPGNYSVGGTSINLYRNTDGANYPYTISGLVTLTSSSSTTNPATFYYYLYDWEVQGISCKTDRVPVNVTVSSADFSYSQDSLVKEISFTDLSQGAVSWLWSFGDGLTSTQQNPVHLYPGIGGFVVSLTVNGLCTVTDTIFIEPSVGITEWTSGLEIGLQPNPADGQVRVTFSQALKENVHLRLIAADGREIERKTLLPGQTYTDWDIHALPAAVYLIQAQNSQGQKNLRLVVE
ncbi:MAG: T9SS-dependent M36 family metallopeptidase [Bacteroidia bacterium]|nr:T9SS-dependent M36 family metallopeptidase [Bacteroidia bacterium]